MTLEDLLRSAGVPIAPEGHHHVRPGWVGFDCPTCSPGWLKFRCGYNTRTGRVHCWQCGRMDPVRTLAALTHRPYDEIKTLLATNTYLEHVEYVHAGTYVAPYGLCDLGEMHRDYLARRGFNPDEIIDRWHVRSFTETAGYHHKYRIFIPFEHEREVVSYTARSVAENETVRYVNAHTLSESIPMKHLLYGEDYCTHAVIVCEGPTDVWRIGPGAVATMGLSITPQQIARIARYPTRVLCFDNEPRAQKRATELAMMLRARPGRTFVVNLNAKDPGSAGEEEVKELRTRFLT